MEKLLQALKDHFDIFDFFNTLDDYVQIMNPNLSIIWINDGGKKMAEQMGVANHDHTNLFEWLPFLVPYKEKITEEYQRVLDYGEKVITEETSLINGKEIHTKIIKMPLIRDEEIKYIITQIHDQTEIVNSREIIEKERNQLFKIFDSINENIYVSDIDTYDILYVNNYLANNITNLTGVYSIKGQKCYKMFHNLDSPCNFCNNDMLRQNPNEPIRYQSSNKFFDGHFLVTDKIIKWENGENAKFGITIDISDEFKVKQKLEETIEKLEISNKMLEDFAHIISHDLREPLRTVVNFLMLLDESATENQDLVNKAYQSSLRMQKMISNLLLLSQLNKEVPFSKHEINVKKLLSEISDDLQVKINETETIIEISSGINYIHGQYQLIRQLFLNLINNSITYKSEKTPIIKVNSVDQEKDVLFSVSDNGKGMTEKDIEDTFNVFSGWEKHVELTRGMGVSICRRTIALHDGKIWAESDGLNGTTVYFSFPKEIL